MQTATTTDDWRNRYLKAYEAANGRTAEIVLSKPGWYKIRTEDGYTTSIQYRRKQIEAMTDRLLERAASGPAASQEASADSEPCDHQTAPRAAP